MNNCQGQSQEILMRMGVGAVGGGGGRYLDGEGSRCGAAEVAPELSLLGDLLQQRVAGDLPRARPPEGHLQKREETVSQRARDGAAEGEGDEAGEGDLAVAGRGHRHRRRGAEEGRRTRAQEGTRTRPQPRARAGRRRHGPLKGLDYGRAPLKRTVSGPFSKKKSGKTATYMLHQTERTRSS